MTKLKFHPNLILRTPRRPFFDLHDIEKRIDSAVLEPSFLEAIYLASPALHGELIKCLANTDRDSIRLPRKLKHAVYKYLVRESNRCTPFGLFASCSVAKWGDTTDIQLAEARRTTRLDMDLCCAVVEFLLSVDSVRTNIRFYINNSLTKIGESYRFVRHELIGNSKRFQINKVVRDANIDLVFNSAKHGATIAELIAPFVGDGIEAEEAREFIDQIISSRILVSELEPRVTGSDCFEEIIHVIGSIAQCSLNQEVLEILKKLQQVKDSLIQFDLEGLNSSSKYDHIVKTLEEIGVSTKFDCHFQVDQFRSVGSNMVSVEIKEELLNAIKCLSKVAEPTNTDTLENFKQKFRDKYDDREVPLSLALDAEMGIDYTGVGSGISSIVDDLAAPLEAGPSYAITWRGVDKLLFEKLLDAHKNNQRIIRLDFADFEKVSSKQEGLNLSVPIMFRIVDSNSSTAVLEYAGLFSSANCLLGRFAYGDPEIEKIVSDVAVSEQGIASNFIICEVAHMPDNRMGNILIRPCTREYEIPYMARCGNADGNAIPVEDILVSVVENKVYLRSVKLNKYILPRLSVAHNFRFNGLPVYRFLADMQFQESRTSVLKFSWGLFAKSFKFHPRVEIGKVIVSPAEWNFIYEDIVSLPGDVVNEADAETVRNWIEKHQLPEEVIFKEGDNELLFNLHQPLSLQIFLTTIKGRGDVHLVENICGDSTGIYDFHNGEYKNEFVAVAVNEECVLGKPPVKLSGLQPNVQRTFPIGSEWIYFKIYSGFKQTDEILSDILPKIIEEGSRDLLFEKWFFVRYMDPEPHLRLRFYHPNSEVLMRLVPIMNRYISPLLNTSVVSRMSVETYARELERYGFNAVVLAESIFHIDSCATVNVLQRAHDDDELLLFYALKSTDQLLSLAYNTTQEKLEFIEPLRLAFIEEYSTKKEFRLLLDSKYRKIKKRSEDLLLRNTVNRSAWPEIETLLRQRNQNMHAVFGLLSDMMRTQACGVTMPELIASYSHMNINRVFKSKQRLHEMVIYDVLYRHYKSQIARLNKNER